MAAKAGASYISPLIGRIDDMREDGMRLIYDLKTVLDNYGLESEIIAASIRTNKYLEEAAIAGAHIATIPGALFEKMWTHPLTTQGIESFKKDWDSFIEKNKSSKKENYSVKQSSKKSKIKRKNSKISTIRKPGTD